MKHRLKILRIIGSLYPKFGGLSVEEFKQKIKKLFLTAPRKYNIELLNKFLGLLS